MREKIFTPLLAFICLVALGACATRQGEIGAATSATPSAPTPQPTLAPSATPASVTPLPGDARANYTPVTLPVLDAFFVDEGFADDLKNRVGLKDEEIARLRKAAREDTAALRETDDGEGRAQSAEQSADKKIKAVVGKEKAEQLYALVRERWGGAGETGGKLLPPIEENAVPTDTRVVVNAPAYRMDVFENGRLIKSYRIGIGYPEFPLPTGLRQAKQIIFNPTWTPPDEPWVEGSNKVKPGEKVPAGSKLNPLGAAKIPIGLPSLIHGGKAAERIGGFASHGCVGLTDEQLIEFTKLLARLGGAELTDAQIAEFRRNPTETKTVDLPTPVPVELRYETIVVENGALRFYRDVYGRGTNTEEHLRKVLAAHGTKLEELSETERMQAMDALGLMGRDAKGREVSVDAPTLAGSPSPSPSPAKKPTSGSVTRQIKGEKELTVAVAALQGEQGYPAPVALNAGRKTPTPPARGRKR
jgi:lipoprotein-anchoring transpeptidase ErfK/SrfK